MDQCAQKHATSSILRWLQMDTLLTESSHQIWLSLLPGLSITNTQREDLSRQGHQCSSIRVHTPHLTQLLGTYVLASVLQSRGFRTQTSRSLTEVQERDYLQDSKYLIYPPHYPKISLCRPLDMASSCEMFDGKWAERNNISSSESRAGLKPWCVCVCVCNGF